MKPLFTALLLGLMTMSAMAQSVTFPTLSYPEPAPIPEPVTQSDTSLNR